jgi:hypothetical protein
MTHLLLLMHMHRGLNYEVAANPGPAPWSMCWSHSIHRNTYGAATINVLNNLLVAAMSPRSLTEFQRQ